MFPWSSARYWISVRVRADTGQEQTDVFLKLISSLVPHISERQCLHFMPFIYVLFCCKCKVGETLIKLSYLLCIRRKGYITYVARTDLTPSLRDIMISYIWAILMGKSPVC